VRDNDHPIVHLELHTGDLRRAGDLLSRLCGWKPNVIDTAHGAYTALTLGQGMSGGIVECATRRPLWLPYVEVADIVGATQQAQALGATVLLTPREGPAGWRRVVATATGGELAFWQPKRALPTAR